jgi:hypothetical protein
VIHHAPIPAYTLNALLTSILVWAFFELAMWGVIFLLGELPLPAVSSALRPVERTFNSLACHRSLVVAGVFLLVFVGRLVMLGVWPVPYPKTLDEFSELLSADTFAHGRVTNPTPAAWFYLETFFVNEKPTYHSMYPPATGAVMAASQVLTGQPWYGMLLAVAAAAAAICWMLQGWVPPRWALWGTLVFLLLTCRNELTENFVGEGLVILGGALVLGAIPRIVKKWRVTSAQREERPTRETETLANRETLIAGLKPRLSTGIGVGICLGIGMALLATTRPYEGFFLVAGLGIGGMWWAGKAGMRTKVLLTRVALPSALVLVVVFAANGYVNWRSTGSPFLTPYQLNLDEQHITRPLVWQKLVTPPHYDHKVMALHYQQWEVDWWKSTHGSLSAVALFLANKAEGVYAPTVWPLAFLVAVGSYALLKRRDWRFLPMTFFLFLAGLGLETYQLQHRYAQAVWGLVLLLAVHGLRQIEVWRPRGRPSGESETPSARVATARQGLRMSRAAMALIPATLFLSNCVMFRVKSHSADESWCAARHQIMQAMEALPGKQLLIVRYAPSHFPIEEWVFNQADIDTAKVVWARDGSEPGNAELLDYFKDRTVWLLEPDGEYAKLTPYCTEGTVRPELAGTTAGAAGSRLANMGAPVTVSQAGAYRVACCGGPCQGAK